MIKIFAFIFVVLTALIGAKAMSAEKGPAYKLAFYMLDSEEAPVTPETPLLVTKSFSEKNNFIIADYDPNLSVETKESFFQSTFLKVMNNKSLKSEEKNEMTVVKDWINSSSKKFVGFQLIRQ